MNKQIIEAILTSEMNTTVVTEAMSTAIKTIAAYHPEVAEILCMGILGVKPPECPYAVGQEVVVNADMFRDADKGNPVILTVTSVNPYTQECKVKGIYKYKSNQNDGTVKEYEGSVNNEYTAESLTKHLFVFSAE